MLRLDQVPDEVVEAAARALKDHPLVPFTEDAALVIARASIAAALNAWPGMFSAIRTEEGGVEWDNEGNAPECLVLPLPQEKQND